MNEISVLERNELEPVVTALETINRRQAEALSQMSLQMRMMAETLEELKKEVRRLEKITPMQVTELNNRIRKHSRELCEGYGITGCETKVNNLIRAAVKAEFGVGSMKELCRADFNIAKNVIDMWEDSERLFRMGG